MGCVSSNLINHEDNFGQLGSSSLGQHIVSLTSTTYGLLSLDPPPPPPPPPHLPQTPPPRRFTFGSIFSSPLSEPHSLRSEPPEVINSWELMAGLDVVDSFRFPPIPTKPASDPSPTTTTTTTTTQSLISDKENSNPNWPMNRLATTNDHGVLKPCNKTLTTTPPPVKEYFLDLFEFRCPPNGENRVVVYTTSLRSVRKTYEACSAVLGAIEGLGFWVCQRDISMDRGFREELRELMKGKDSGFMIPPRVFVKGRYVGGAEEVLRIAEDGILGGLLEGLPKIRAGAVCEGCGDARFLPCFGCNGSCKIVMVIKENKVGRKHRRSVAVRCPDCNENGLVLCPICS